LKEADTLKRLRPIEYVPFVKTIKLKIRTISYGIVLFTNMKENYLNTNYLTGAPIEGGINQKL
jgi:hypothetical protein